MTAVRHLLLTFLLTGLFMLPAKAAREDTLAALAAVKGADMNIWRLWSDKLAAERDEAMEYAALFLQGLDSLAANSTAAHMADQLAEYTEKELFRFSEAIRWNTYAGDIWTRLGNSLEAARAQFRNARLYYRLGQYHKTLRLVTEARREFLRHGSKAAVDLAECDNLTGAVFQACGNHDKGYSYFLSYAEQARKLRDSIRLVVALNNSAVYSDTVSDTLKTRKLIQESFQICRRTGDTSLMCQIYQNIAAATLNAGLADESENYLNESKALLHTVEEYGIYYRNLALLNYVRGDLEGAGNSIRRSICYLDSGEFFLIQQRNWSILHQICTENGDTAGAYEALNRYYALEQKLGRDKVITEFFNYQNEMIRSQELERAREARTRRAMTYGLSTLGLMLAMLFGYLLMRKKSVALKLKESELERRQLQNEKDEQELRSRNEMVEMKRMQQYQMDRLTEQLVEDLRKLESETKDAASRTKIREMRARISGSRDESRWKELNQYIPEFNSDFFRQLLADWPDLSVNERRLCALLNLNLSTKEISEITRQSPNTINMARGKLRAKFGLTGSSATIQEFLARYGTAKNNKL